jgi:hypothetical protein
MEELLRRQMLKDPCPNCRKFIPNTEVTKEMGRNMNVSRVVALVSSVTSFASSVVRLASDMEKLLSIVDLPPSHNSVIVLVGGGRWGHEV